MQQEVRALPGAADLIANCTSAGLTAVLATSGKAADLDWMLARIDAGTDLAGATTSDDVAQSKPAPDLMLAALAAHQLNPARTVAVGDSVWDGRAAQAAGLLRRSALRRRGQRRTPRRRCRRGIRQPGGADRPVR